MIVFEHPLGLLFLSTIPILLFMARRKAIPKRIFFTGFFLLDKLQKPPQRKIPRILRVKRRHRIALAVAMIFFLSMGLAGTSCRYKSYQPSRWLVVIDNPATAVGKFNDSTVLQKIKETVRDSFDGKFRKDRISLLVTSPFPELTLLTPGPEMNVIVDSITASGSFEPVENIVSSVQDLARWHRGTVVLSPRAEKWRKNLDLIGRDRKIIVPPDHERRIGNAGLTKVVIRPNPGSPGNYDLYVTAALIGMDNNDYLSFLISHNNRLLSSPAGFSLQDGAGEIFLINIPLPPGEVELQVPFGDGFSFDNRVAFQIPGPRLVSVTLMGQKTAVLEAAVESGENFTLAEEGEVAIIMGNPPPVLEQPSLIINPSTDIPGLKFRQLTDIVGKTEWNPSHPVTFGLGETSLYLSRATSYEIGGDYRIIGSADGIPIVLAGEHGSQPVVVWTFDPQEGGVFLKPEFVILLRESIEWLVRRNAITPSPQPDMLITSEAADLTIPKLDSPLFEKKKTFISKVSLVPFCLLAAMLIGGFIGLVDSFAPGGADLL